jgi:hypothetical protein
VRYITRQVWNLNAGGRCERAARWLSSRFRTSSLLTLHWRELDSNLRFRARAGSIFAREVRGRLFAGGRWIRTFSTAARKPRISEASRASRMPLAPGEGDVAKSRRSRLRCFPQNGTAPLVKVPAPSGPAAFPLQDATVGSRNRGAGQRDHQKHRFPARPSAVTSHLSPTRTCDRTKARAAPEAPALDQFDQELQVGFDRTEIDALGIPSWHEWVVIVWEGDRDAR